MWVPGSLLDKVGISSAGSLGWGGTGKEEYHIFSTEYCHFYIHKNRSKSHGRVTMKNHYQSLGVIVSRLPSSISVYVFIKCLILFCFSHP